MSSDLVLNDRYRLVDLLATGGMGEVWRAADTALDRDVAVKLLRQDLMEDVTAQQRFRSEARFAAALRHPGIAQVYDVGAQDGRLYLVMELVAGEPLAEIIDRAGALPPDAVLDLVEQSARALAAAHAAGIVHRDIKPANLLVTGDGTVKITDFGIARRLTTASQTQTGMVMGTAYYISPEQASGKTVTPAADLYSLGVVAYESLTGCVPFDAENAVAVALMHVRDVPPPLPGQVPGPLRVLVDELLAKDPAWRPLDADETADRARLVLDSPDISGPGLSHWTRPTGPGRDGGPGVTALRNIAAVQAGGPDSAEPNPDPDDDWPAPPPVRARNQGLSRGDKPGPGSAPGGGSQAVYRPQDVRTQGMEMPTPDETRDDWDMESRTRVDGGAGSRTRPDPVKRVPAGVTQRMAGFAPTAPAGLTRRDPAGALDDPWPVRPGRPGRGRGATGDLSGFDGKQGADNLGDGEVTGRRRTKLTYASVAAGALLLGVVVVGTMWRGLGAAEPVRENQEPLPAVQPGEGDPARHLPADPPTRLQEHRGREASPKPTRSRSATPRYPRASPSMKPTTKPPRATPSAPDPTPTPTETSTTPSPPTPKPPTPQGRQPGSQDKA